MQRVISPQPILLSTRDSRHWLRGLLREFWGEVWPDAVAQRDNHASRQLARLLDLTSRKKSTNKFAAAVYTCGLKS